MNYAIEILESQLDAEKYTKTVIKGSFKNIIQENIDDLELAIHNLKMLE